MRTPKPLIPDSRADTIRSASQAPTSSARGPLRRRPFVRSRAPLDRTSQHCSMPPAGQTRSATASAASTFDLRELLLAYYALQPAAPPSSRTR